MKDFIYLNRYYNLTAKKRSVSSVSPFICSHATWDGASSSTSLDIIDYSGKVKKVWEQGDHFFTIIQLLTEPLSEWTSMRSILRYEMAMTETPHFWAMTKLKNGGK